MQIGVLLAQLGTPAIYYPKIAKITGGVTSAILLDRLLQWQSQLGNSREGVRKSDREIEATTGLNPTEQELARRQLRDRSLLQEKMVNPDENLLEFWIDVEVLEKQFHDQIAPQNLSPSIESKRDPQQTDLEVVPTASPHQKTVKTDKYFGQQRQPIAVAVSPHYRFSGPWQSNDEFEAFQRTLLDYFKNQGVANPAAFVFKIIDGLTKGIISPYWDEFINGLPLGSSQRIKRDWEMEAGIPYPAFEEERIQYYVHKGEPLEVAVSKARADLRNPVLGQDLWEGFLRKCDRMADAAMQAKNLGVQTPYLPPSFTEKQPVTKESVMRKLEAISPRFFLESTRSNSLSFDDPEIQDSSENQSELAEEIPSLASLQSAYQTPMGRALVEKQIAQNPDWGYEIVNGKIIKSIPF